MAPTVNNRAGAGCPDRTRQRCVQQTALRTADHQLYNCTALTSWAHRRSLSKRRELVLSSLPTPPPPFFFADSRPPVSKVACLISLYLLSTCMYHTFSHISFLGYNHMHPRASVLLDSLLSEHISSDDTCVLGGGSFPVTIHGFSSRGVAAVRARRLSPVDLIRGKGLSSRLTPGSKIRLTAGFEPCLQGLAPSILAAAHSPFQCVPCFVHSIPVLAASHSSLA